MKRKILIVILYAFVTPNFSHAACDPGKADCKAAIDFFGRLLNGVIAKGNCPANDIQCKRSAFAKGFSSVTHSTEFQVKADYRSAIFLNGTWRITESGMGITPPYDIKIKIDSAGRMRAFYLGKKPLGTCPPEASNYPELAALCGTNHNAEPMNIRGWRLEGRNFIFENNLYDIVEHFELNITNNQKMQGRAYNYTPSMPGIGRTRNRSILMLKVRD